MNIFQKLAFKLIKNNVDDYVKGFLSGDNVGSGNDTRGINSTAAMKYSAVFACNRVLAETFASCPAAEYRKKSDGTREYTSDTAAYDILHNKPNEEMAPFNFKEACMGAINLGGNSVSQKLYNKAGELKGLYPFQHTQVQISRKDKKLNYTIRDNGLQVDLGRENVFHVPGISVDGVIGMSPISYISEAIRLGLSYEKFGVNFYKNGANPSIAIKYPHALSDEAFKRLKNDLEKNVQGLMNTGKPLLLEDGGDAVPLTIKPADAQLIENKRFQIEDICRIYRVPLHLVQDLSRSTNNNIEHQSLEFVMYTMLPHFKRWEENINMQLLTPAERRAGYYIEFNVAGLLRGDMKTRAGSYAVARQWGWLSVNDIRKLENMPPIENGNIYLSPLNMGEAGKEPQKTNEKVLAMTENIIKMIKEGV